MKGNCEENKTAYDCLRNRCEFAAVYDGCQFDCTKPKDKITSYINVSSKQKEEMKK